ncbi:unnamed protein product [Clonostachys solani]|uniref:Cytochrome P450 n=1 Tax=Clonostachys solani TaxID=160281 RepID=A0A9N9Z9P7_9HYPO|nr:unnamed protein product [Clonostachys solani]
MVLRTGRRRNSAITQVFLRPFTKLAVLVSDFREANDILSHRDGIDFKRGKKVDAFPTGLGPECGDIKRQFDHLVTSEGPSDLSLDMDEIVKLDILPKSPKLRALEMSEGALSKSSYMPSPRPFHAVNDLRPSVSAAKRTIKSFVDSQVAAAVEKLHKNVEPESALDYIIHRETKSAEKSGRAPAVHDPRILDITQCYMTAGHDTSTCSMLWIMRRLMADPEQQVRIRQSLRVTYREAYNEQRVPNAQEFGKHSAYLEAFVEEVLRYNCPVPTILVMTKRDTILLGHHIPADTQVFLNLTGPSLTTPSLTIQEQSRNHTARMYRHKAAHDNWDDFDPAAFRPERWLRQDEQGTMIFSPSSGPSLSLSAGNRGCWGQKLGYLEIRILSFMGDV